MDFGSTFEAATRHPSAYEYQRALAGCGAFRSDRSLLIDIPTGMGKTAAVVFAWLWNRVLHPSRDHREQWPRRLVYCLPMRTLVRQTEGAIRQWLENLPQDLLSPEILWLRERSPAVLMGGEGDDTDCAGWDLWPEKPAILIGTQDMLLSRALNRGYSLSRYRWPLHFGLLSSDCLWVMDEVQLMGPGLWTSGQLDWMRNHRFPAAKPCWTWWMSATQSAGFLETTDRRGVVPPAKLPFDETSIPSALRAAQRPCALWPDETLRRAESSELAAAVARQHVRGTLTLAVCNTVATAQTLYREIANNLAGVGHAPDLILLTSRFRRRDRISSEEALIGFEKERRSGGASGLGLICVATQVVEAGLDVSATRLWSEVAPWPSILQRLGRLNRDGSGNESAQAFFFEMGAKAASGVVGPYPGGALEGGRRLAIMLTEICASDRRLTALEAVARLRGAAPDAMAEALRPPFEPFPRAMDLHGLFSTEPDLFGGFTDVSQFVRGTDPQADVTAFWRAFDPKAGPPVGDDLDGPGFGPDEGCAVRLAEIRDFLERADSPAWIWDDETDGWTRINRTDIAPGMLLMLPREIGGYSIAKGWTGQCADRVPDVALPGPLSHSFAADPASRGAGWVTLQVHLDDVRREAETIAQALQLAPEFAKSLSAAAAHHDVGKAMPAWQGELPSPPPVSSEIWAKAPFLFAVQAKTGEDVAGRVEEALSSAGIRFRRAASGGVSRLNGCELWQTSARLGGSHLERLRAQPGISSARMVRFRPGLRHEAASALALWFMYFRLNADFPALAIYLAAAHHGKVRTVLSARSRSGQDACGVSFDSPPLPWDGGMPLDFACAADGAAGNFSADGRLFFPDSAGWTAMVIDLLGGWEAQGAQAILAARQAADPEPADIGPFSLAFYEALLVAADIRASQSPSHEYPVE